MRKYHAFDSLDGDLQRSNISGDASGFGTSIEEGVVRVSLTLKLSFLRKCETEAAVTSEVLTIRTEKPCAPRKNTIDSERSCHEVQYESDVLPQQ